MEVTTIKPVHLEIYSYSNCFTGCTKKRPGFKIKNGVWCLTHTKPKNKHIEIDASQINSEHFTCETPTVYLTKALRTAKRYNNQVGGVITLTSENQKEIGVTNISPSHCLTLTLNSNSMSTKLLSIQFSALGPIMISDLGTDKITDQTQLETAYELCVANETKCRELSEDEKLRIGTETYNTILPVFQRRQLLSMASLLHAFDATLLYEKFQTMPVDQLEATLNHANALSDGNPTVDGSAAEIALLDLATTTGLDYNIDGYNPVPVDEAAAAIPDEPQQTNPDNTNEYVGVLDEAHTTTEEETEPAEEAATTNAVAKPVITGNLPRVEGIQNLKDLNDKATTMIDMGLSIQKEVVDKVFKFAGEAAVHLDGIEAGNQEEVIQIEKEAAAPVAV